MQNPPATTATTATTTTGGFAFGTSAPTFGGVGSGPFTFGQSAAATTTTSAAAPLFGSFVGQPSSGLFGAKPGTTGLFGQALTNATSTAPATTTSSAAAPSFTFGTTSATTPFATAFPTTTTAKSTAVPFSFGSTTSAAPLFASTSASTAPAAAPAFTFGAAAPATTTSGGGSFTFPSSAPVGGGATIPTTTTTAPGFAFSSTVPAGTVTSIATGGFTFGTPTVSTASAPAAPIFGTTTATTSAPFAKSLFGDATAAKPLPVPGFQFGAATTTQSSSSGTAVSSGSAVAAAAPSQTTTTGTIFSGLKMPPPKFESTPLPAQQPFGIQQTPTTSAAAPPPAVPSFSFPTVAAASTKPAEQPLNAAPIIVTGSTAMTTAPMITLTTPAGTATVASVPATLPPLTAATSVAKPVVCLTTQSLVKPVPSVSFATTTTATAAPTTGEAPLPKHMTYKQLEGLINKWTHDVKELKEQFFSLATCVNARDRVVRENGEKIAALHSKMKEMAEERDRVEYEVRFISQQQEELLSIVDQLEKEFAKDEDFRRAEYKQECDVQREDMYQGLRRQAALDTQLRQLVDDVDKVFQRMSMASETVNSDDPVMQITQIMGKQMQMMQWIEQKYKEVNAKCETLSSVTNSLMRSNDRLSF